MTYVLAVLGQSHFERVRAALESHGERRMDKRAPGTGPPIIVRRAMIDSPVAFAAQLQHRRWDAALLSPREWRRLGSERFAMLDILLENLAFHNPVRFVTFIESLDHPLGSIHEVARRVPTGLFVDGIDGVDDLLRFVLGPAAAGVPPESPSARQASQRRFDATKGFPLQLREALLMARDTPDQWPLKRIVQACGMTRRTLERRLKVLGLPSPARLLRFTVESED